MRLSLIESINYIDCLIEDVARLSGISSLLLSLLSMLSFWVLISLLLVSLPTLLDRSIMIFFLLSNLALRLSRLRS